MIRVGVVVVALSAATGLTAPSNPNASEATKRLLQQLVEGPQRASHQLISGQYVGHGPQVVAGYTTDVVDLHRETGAWVTLIGADYAFGSLNDHWFEQVNSVATQHWQAGGLVTLCLCSLNNPVTGGDATDRSFHDLVALSTSGTDANAKWLAQLERVAAALTVLRDRGVVVLFRPLHEMNLPNSYWWADAPAADYVALWRQLYRFFTVDKGLDNLLWVFAPNGVAYDNGTRPPADFYPGDDVVDVVGLDWYSNTPEKLEAGGYDALVATGKPFALTEFGPDLGTASSQADLVTLLSGVRTHAPRAAWFLTWQDYGGKHLSLASLKNSAQALSDLRS